VYAWLDHETAIGAKGLPAKASAIRQFGSYLCAMDNKAFVLPEKFATNSKGFMPYIFTDSELTSLFMGIDRLSVDANEPFLYEIAPVLFRLIYTCGLRPNEGRELLCENIDLDSGEILITHTKQRKERIVVMSNNMRAMCLKYGLRRKIFGVGSPYFFPSKDGSTLKGTKVLAALNRAWTLATCTPHSPIPQRIRIYDLRHRFASACLNRWLDEKRDLMVMLPYLCAYMGHRSMNETAYYIHILPENLSKSPSVDWGLLNSMFSGASAQ